MNRPTTHDIAVPLLGQRPRATVRPIARAILAAAPGGPGEGPAARSLYIHVPFCFHKCHYCDFYSLVDTRDRQGPFVHRLERELAALAPLAGPLRTLFVGGGTPSLLRPELWKRLLGTLRRTYDLSDPDLEFTVECNPETVTPELMETLRDGGVNRVSIGAQSFEPRHLKTLERWHDPESVPRALDLARRARIGRQSIDLIHAIPGQSLGEARADLDRALALATEHLSCYCLTYEPNTALAARRQRGEFTPADNDLEADMLELVLSTLRAAGRDRYEVSNFARPGAECRHNLAYWRQDPWLAVGPSAAAHLGGHRWKNTARLDDYLSIDEDGFAPIAEHEPPDARRALRERVMTGLRLVEGLDADETLAAADTLGPAVAAVVPRDPHAVPLPQRLRALVERQERAGLLTTASGRWRLTDPGFLLADRVAAEFLRTIG